MQESYSIALSELIREFSLTPLTMPDNPENIQITNAEVDRPGLALGGFFDIFERSRMQIVGKAEDLYLSECEPMRRQCRHRSDHAAHHWYQA